MHVYIQSVQEQPKCFNHNLCIRKWCLTTFCVCLTHGMVRLTLHDSSQDDSAMCCSRHSLPHTIYCTYVKRKTISQAKYYKPLYQVPAPFKQNIKIHNACFVQLCCAFNTLVKPNWYSLHLGDLITFNIIFQQFSRPGKHTPTICLIVFLFFFFSFSTNRIDNIIFKNRFSRANSYNIAFFLEFRAAAFFRRRNLCQRPCGET